jgi:hypothetical protein
MIDLDDFEEASLPLVLAFGQDADRASVELGLPLLSKKSREKRN